MNRKRALPPDDGLPIIIGGYAYVRDGKSLSRATLHPKTGQLVRESDVCWPDDYPPETIAKNLLDWYGPTKAHRRAVELGAWEAAMILEERRPE